MTLRKRHIIWVALLLVSSPTNTDKAWAGAWTQPKGKTWFRAGTMFQSTSERYFIDGRRIPYFFEGHNRTVGFFFDFEHGVTEQLEVSAHLPFFGVTFNDLADDRQSNGIGDVRVGARYNILRGPFVATIGGRVKFPTGEFVNDAEIIPVGEGQYDFEVKGELAHSFWPHPTYITGFIGYKFRTKNEENGISYGDEIFWSAEGGYHLRSRHHAQGGVLGPLWTGIHFLRSPASFTHTSNCLSRAGYSLRVGTFARHRAVSSIHPLGPELACRTGSECGFLSEILKDRIKEEGGRRKEEKQNLLLSTFYFVLSTPSNPSIH